MGSFLLKYVPLETLYRESDVISLHLPLTPETHHMINAETLSLMKKGVVLINCARGALTDIKSLISGIESEQIGALGLDCIEYEEDIVHRDLRTDILSNRDMAYLRQFKCYPHPAYGFLYGQRRKKHGSLRSARTDRDDSGKRLRYTAVLMRPICLRLCLHSSGTAIQRSFNRTVISGRAKSGSPSFTGTLTSP